ncbi:MAG: ZIP family metal transporter [Candidatus Micrarchaeota archaeon]|nr:ZIP family metal transporter [Candidatus Micrarchaeota archaeon]
MELIFALAAAIIVSLFSLVGLIIYSPKISKYIYLLVAFAAGALLGGAFFHLIDEALEIAKNFEQVAIFVLSGFVLFFILEKFLFWHHCHDKEPQCKHHLSYMNLYGDVLHNFIDGLAIGTAFSIDINIGIATSAVIILHEIPQELGDMGILLHFGMKKSKALFLNFLVSLSAVLGSVVGFYLSENIEPLKLVLICIAAGGFIYIASADLVPELHKEQNKKYSFIGFLLMLGGIILLYIAKILFE